MQSVPAAISTDTLKEILPDFDPAAAAVAKKTEESNNNIQNKKQKIESPRMERLPKTDKTEEKKEEEVLPEKREGSFYSFTDKRTLILISCTVPPSRRPVSNVLYVTNFVRPFLKQHVQDLLSQTGKIVQWGMDQIKSRCYVIVRFGLFFPLFFVQFIFIFWF